MRISDWSSDVCSSDLGGGRWRFIRQRRVRPIAAPASAGATLFQPASFPSPAIRRRSRTGTSASLTCQKPVTACCPAWVDRKGQRLNSSHYCPPRIPSSAEKKNKENKPKKLTHKN